MDRTVYANLMLKRLAKASKRDGCVVFEKLEFHQKSIDCTVDAAENTFTLCLPNHKPIRAKGLTEAVRQLSILLEVAHYVHE